MIISCLLFTFAYSWANASNNLIIQNIGGFSLCLFLLFAFLLVQSLSDHQKIFKLILVSYTTLVFGILLFSLYLGVVPQSFWVPDSVATHLPESLKFKTFLTDGQDISFSFKDFFKTPGRLTHTLTGISLYLFGDNFFATGVAQLLFKLVTMVTILKSTQMFFNRNIAITAVSLYAFTPTVFFYTNVLYKESAIHMLVSLAFYCLLKFIFSKRYFYFSIASFLCLLLLFGERYYLAPLFVFPFIGFLLTLFFDGKKSLYIFCSTGLICFFMCFYFFPEKFNLLWTRVENLRNFHSSFGDIANQINYHIPYPVAVVKTLFSPYFTLNKFSIFVGFSNLLIWGSFINQLVILFSLFGFFSNLKKSVIHFYIWLPFIIFLLFAAYISPWSGRTRDSFYPIIVCYAAYFLHSNEKIISFFKKIERFFGG